MKYKIEDLRILPEHMVPSTAGANSVDLRACISDDLVIYAREQVLIDTGIKVALPEDSLGMILPRSGLGVKGLVLGNLVGNIDSDYRGNVKVCLWNRNESGYITISPMDRIAQLVVVPVFSPTGWDQVDELDATKRGESGFGSTGSE